MVHGSVVKAGCRWAATGGIFAAAVVNRVVNRVVS
jgi:hypothetical protein